MKNTIPLPPLDWPEFLPGWVWLCGAGPGDAGLLTLHGLNALQQADVIVYDALVNEEILAWANPQAEKIYAGKCGGKISAKQVDISQQLVELAQSGKRVLRLKGGDPFVFGRGGEEAQALVAQGIAFRIIPGISAGIGGLAYAGIPVTHGAANQSVTFVSGHDRKGQASALNWQAISDGAAVLVLYMAMKHIARISRALLDAGRPEGEPVAVVSGASTPDQRVLETTLGALVKDIETAAMAAPAIICVGPVVNLRQTLDWQAIVAKA
ncbi:MAG: uroporphyrinogen-III C-methyltransferase [Rhodobacteraceae bacterium]|nr:uroporphyrinogen-III C-methyltransferase [Paracoccaceae bacterium]